jgi:hypothetical protein
LGLLAFPVLYFGIQVYNNGWWFVQEFLAYQVDLFKNPVASHGQPFYYHFIVLLLGCFPMFILAFGSMLFKKPVTGDITAYRWMKTLFWVVLIVFSLVTTKIVHYSSMCYIPLAIVGGVWLSNFTVLNRATRVTLGIIGALWVLILFGCGVLFTAEVNHLLNYYVKDNFVLAQLQTNVEGSFIPLVLAVLLLVPLFKTIIKPSKQSISSLLVTNTLVISLLMISFVPKIEKSVQGDWINQLETYKDKEMAHFTLGFKSYAHYYYTEQQDLASVAKLKLRFLKQADIASIYDLNQDAKKDYDFIVREYIINETNIPITLSAKVQKFDEIKTLYPHLTQVFEGNGYGVWERTKVPDK